MCWVGKIVEAWHYACPRMLHYFKRLIALECYMLLWICVHCRRVPHPLECKQDTEVQDKGNREKNNSVLYLEYIVVRCMELWLLHSHCYVHMCQDCIRIGKFSFLIYDGKLCFFLTLALALRLLYYFSFVTAWPAGSEVDSTRVFKGRS